MANRLNVVIGADIQELKKGFDEAIKLVQASGSKMSGSVAEAAKDIQSRLDALASKRPTARVVRELQTLAMEARNLGPEFSGMADKFVMAAGKMQDEIGDTRAQIGYFASDTRRLDAVLGGAQAIAAGFGVVEGSMAAMGVESEDLQKTMAKLQGVMVLLNSLQALHATLLQDSALKTGVMTAVTEIQTAIMNQATVATAALGLSLATLGIGAVILLFQSFSSSMQEVQDESDKTVIAIKELQKSYGDLWKELSKADRNALINFKVNLGKRKEELKNEFDEEKKYADEVISMQKDKNEQDLQALKTKALRAGDTEKQIRDKEIKFLTERINKQKEFSKNYEYMSATRMASDKLVAELSAKKEDLVTAKIVEQNEARKKANKEAEISAKITENAIIAVNTAMAIEPKGLKSNPLIENAIKQQKIAGEYFQKHPLTLPVKADFSSFQTDFVKQMYDAAQEINKQFEQMLESITTSFGEALGNMLSGQDGAFQNFGKQALTTIAEFMKMVGQALIATAIASDAFKKLLLTQPLAAAAAGVALVAGATIIKNKLEKGPEFTAFADGGIVSGPTFALMGEYPNARTNPEVIAPLDKLQKLIGTSSQGSGDSFIASTRISGRDLSIVLERYKQDNSRG